MGELSSCFTGLSQGEGNLHVKVFCKLGRTREKQKAHCHPLNSAVFTNQPRISFFLFFLALGLSEVKSEKSRTPKDLGSICVLLGMVLQVWNPDHRRLTAREANATNSQAAWARERVQVSPELQSKLLFPA